MEVGESVEESEDDVKADIRDTYIEANVITKLVFLCFKLKQT